jgi:hypothetical protein
MRQKKNREINVFSTSAIDLFASSMGVFILLVVITLPFYTKKDNVKVEDLQKKEQQLKDLQTKLDAETQKVETLKLEVKKAEAQKAEVKKVEAPKPPVEIITPPTQQLEEKLKEKIEELEEQKLIVTSLKKEIETLKAIEPKKFLVIILKWSSERHDIDLQVETPENLKYNFKNKSHKQGTGQLALDSRTGPGAEVWQSANASTGTYRVRSQFYNNYGNKNPAQLTLTILTQAGTFEIPAFEMDFSKQNSREFKFTLADDEKVSFD